MVIGHSLDHNLKYYNETWSDIRQNGELSDLENRKLQIVAGPQ